jgi:3-isopropylmalate/(R)-2-methylmalate dehydratase large subunit
VSLKQLALNLNMPAPRTAAQKIWAAHRIQSLESKKDLILIDRIFLHERTGPALLSGLALANRKPANRYSVFGTLDHIIDTTVPRSDDTLFDGGRLFIDAFKKRTKEFGIELFDLNSSKQGIVHVISPELGIALPGMTLVCPDSHTCTVGGIGALAWGIGSTEGEHAVATQTLIYKEPQQQRVTFTGDLHKGITSKDLALALISQFGVSGGQGHITEYAGKPIQKLDIEGRMTLCNLSVEFGSWTGLISADEKTFAWIKNRPMAPKGKMWELATQHWESLKSDENAPWDSELTLSCDALEPQVTWGTSPMHATNISDSVPELTNLPSFIQQQDYKRALEYMKLNPGMKLTDIKIDVAFIGSCTNSRITDLREAASILKGRKVKGHVKAIVVPGSTETKRQAEAEGLDKVFKEAGFEWRSSGCSLCFYAGGESFGEGVRTISTTNRNFEGRQGINVKTHLASPLTVAASALEGKIADPRPYL